MLNVKQAVGAAIEYVKEFGDVFPFRDARLEETEFDRESGTWWITLSFLDRENPLLTSRINKLFEVSADTGVIKSMKTKPFLGTRL